MDIATRTNNAKKLLVPLSSWLCMQTNRNEIKVFHPNFCCFWKALHWKAGGISQGCCHQLLKAFLALVLDLAIRHPFQSLEKVHPIILETGTLFMCFPPPLFSLFLASLSVPGLLLMLAEIQKLKEGQQPAEALGNKRGLHVHWCLREVFKTDAGVNQANCGWILSSNSSSVTTMIL